MKTFKIFFFFIGLFYCCAARNDNVSISLGTRIKRSEGGDIALAAFKLGGALIEKFGTASGSETAQNIGIVVELLGELIENTANNAQHSEETFSLDKQFIYGLIYKVQNKQNLLEVPGVKAISMKKSEFLDAKHISEFAINVYYASAAASTAEVVLGSQEYNNVVSSMKLAANDKILFSWFGFKENNEGGLKNHVPHFMIFTDESTKSVVLAIKGTDNFKDMVLNGVANAIPFLPNLGGHAHKGMAESSKRVIELSKETLNKAFTTYPGYRLVITGHSLGGGVAVLTTMSILKSNVITVPKNVEVKCIVIAPPPVYHSNQPIDEFKKHIQIFIHRYDVVPRLSMYTLAKLYEAASMIHQQNLADTTSTIASLISGETQVDQPTRQKIIDILDNAKPVKSFKELEHPGQIFYLDKLSDVSEVYGIFQTPKKFFAKMLLRDEMLDSHAVVAYEKAFANVDLGSLIDDSAAGGPALLSGMMFLIIIQVHLFWNQLF